MTGRRGLACAAAALAILSGACGGPNVPPVAVDATPTFPALTAAPVATTGAGETAEPVPATQEPASATGIPGPSIPAATEDPNPAIVLFDTPRQEDCTNDSAGSVHVAWEVERASGVTIAIDGPGIYDEYEGLTGEVDLPYGCDHTVLEHTYSLKTVGGTGQWVRVIHTIRTRAASILSFAVSKPDCSSGDPYVGINLSFEVRAATGATLHRDGGLYSTYNTKVADDIVQYDCSQNDQEWTLTTTGQYGPEATNSVKVSKN